MATLAEVREDEAAGRTAELFAAIRAQTGLPLVNLIYRHLATIPGALEWTWAVIEPPLASGAVEKAVEALDSLVGDAVREPAGSDRFILREDEVRDVAAILDVYRRGNLSNLVCLTAALQILEQGRSPTAPEQVLDLTPRRRRPERRRPLPALPKLDQLDRNTAEMVHGLASEHAARKAGVTPSLYLHLAHWPLLLEQIAGPIRAAFREGRVGSWSRDLQRAAARQSEALTNAAGAPRGLAAEVDAARLGEALNLFARSVIPEMVVVGRLIQTRLPAPSNPSEMPTQG